MTDNAGIAHNLHWDHEDEVLSPEAFATHPGPFLKRNVLTERNISATTLADLMQVARPGLTNVLNGKRALTADMAVLIGAALNYPADILVSMMAHHDLAQARAKTELIERVAAMAATVATGLVESVHPANDDHFRRKAV